MTVIAINLGTQEMHNAAATIVSASTTVQGKSAHTVANDLQRLLRQEAKNSRERKMTGFAGSPILAGPGTYLARRCSVGDVFRRVSRRDMASNVLHREMTICHEGLVPNTGRTSQGNMEH